MRHVDHQKCHRIYLSLYHETLMLSNTQCNTNVIASLSIETGRITWYIAMKCRIWKITSQTSFKTHLTGKEERHLTNLSGRSKHSVTAVACWEKIAKLTPVSSFDTPRGCAWPGETFQEGNGSSIGGASSWNHSN